jgi:hypothetical protein
MVEVSVLTDSEPQYRWGRARSGRAGQAVSVTPLSAEVTVLLGLVAATPAML